MKTARIDEVFASIQGEGPWIGQRQIFVRFIGCDLRCSYCDTPDAVKTADGSGRPCRAQRSTQSFDRESVANPLSCADLALLCERLIVQGPARTVISLTGGEPLLQGDFLADWLPVARHKYRIFLETNGVGHEVMRELAALIDVVSMDIKLPSATGQPARWEDHRKFLNAARGKELFVKAVVTKDTAPGDLQAAFSLVAEHGPVPFIIQPACGEYGPSAEFLIRLQNEGLGILADVRIVPQVHKILLVP